MKNSREVLLVATMDTKYNEANYIQSNLVKMGVPVRIMDAGIRGKSPVHADIDRQAVAAAGGKTIQEVQGVGHEGKALGIMIDGARKLAEELYRQGKIHGIIGLGGSMGTTLGTAVMRQFPIGFPKVMISTMASRDTRDFVGTKDILMLHSVCDLSGLNRITRKILSNGAMAMAGMLRQLPKDSLEEKPLVILSTLGTTESCVQRLRKHFEKEGNEVVTFHTVGSGGKAMEEMILDEEVAAVIDLSLHEMADHMFGGDYDAGPSRGMAALKKGVPTVLVPGNVDFLVAGPLKTAQRIFPGRRYHQHNAAITVVPAEKKEMETLADVIAKRCNSATGPYAVVVPTKGFSAFDDKAGPLHNEDSRKVFIEVLTREMLNPKSLNMIPHHINDSEFAETLIRVLEEMLSV
jgi:uncharacterized protein (UPF0261 family)